jgi:Sulfotransferase family
MSRPAHAAGRSPAVSRARGRIPDFFIVGHPKSGTTALYEMLGAHPQIFMPAGKEPWFFADELHDRTPPRPEGTPRTLEQYAALFAAASPEQRVGEASAQYLWSHTAARRIAQAQPRARIVAILREPASFLHSLHLQWLETYVETEADFRSAIELEEMRTRGEAIPRHSYWPQALLYSQFVRYVEQLQRFHDHFNSDQILVLIYDDFRADNEQTVRRVLRFLEVDETLPLKPTEANPTRRVRSQRAHHLLHAISVGHGPVSRALKAGLKPLIPERRRRGTLRALREQFVYTAPDPPDEQLMSELRARFKGEVLAASEYLDRDLVTLWGYDDID